MLTKKQIEARDRLDEKEGAAGGALTAGSGQPKKTNTMTLNLPDDDWQILKTLSQLDDATKTAWMVQAIRHYAPISVIKRRTPEFYHRIMVAAYKVASHAAWRPCKLASDEQTSLFLGEAKNDAIMESVRMQAEKILNDLEEGKA